MTLLEMGDSSRPPAHYPPVSVWAFYIGGDTPHIWADAEVRAIPATYGLPIWVNTIPQLNGGQAAAAILAWLHGHGWEQGTAVAIDTEAVVEPGWITEVDQAVTADGYKVIDYQSKSPVASNPVTSGGRWIADWTGVPHLYPGSVATQYQAATQAGTDYDKDVIEAGVLLHKLHGPVSHPPVMLPITVTLPELVRGDQGPAVRRCQGLINAWVSPPVEPLDIDGIFGPLTQQAIGSFQRIHGLTADLGTVTAPTWTALLEG